MRRRHLLAVWSALLVVAACHPPRRQPLFHSATHTFAAAPGKLVRCNARFLDLEIYVQPQGDIQVTVDLEASSPSGTVARRWLERHTPTFQDSAARLDIALPRGHSDSIVLGSLRAKGRVRVNLPFQCNLMVESSSGDIRIGGKQALAGPVRVRTASGDIVVAGGVDDLIVRSASGDLVVVGRALKSLEFLSASGDLRVDSGCGNVMVDTSSGDVELAELSGTLSATTSSGDVVASWRQSPPHLMVKTSSGDISLKLPATSQLRGQARSSSGHIRSLFEGTANARGTIFTWSGPATACAVDILTSSGDVRLGWSTAPPPSHTPPVALEAEPQRGEKA